MSAVITNPKTLRKLKEDGKIGKALVATYGAKKPAQELVESPDPYQWLYILLNHTKKGSDVWFYEEFPKHIKKQGYVSKQDHIKVLDYKMKRGEFRPALFGYANKLAEADVEAVSKKAIAAETAQEAVETYKGLKGTGYALASAIISAQRDGAIPFMSDELLAVVLKDKDPKKAPKYNLDELKRCIAFTQALATEFNKSQKAWKWTPSEIERVVYVSSKTT